MNTNTGDFFIPNDHGLKMDSDSATHDDMGDNLDLILATSNNDADNRSGPSVSQQSSSTAVSGNLRCVNCSLNVSRMRRHTLEIVEVRCLIQRWVGLHQVNK